MSDFSCMSDLCFTYASLFDVNRFLEPSKHKTMRSTKTTGPPSAVRVRRLSPVKFEILKEEINRLLELDSIRESS